MEEDKILKIMHDNSTGLSITDIVNLTNISRSATRINLARLEGAGKISVRRIGMAKVYILNRINSHTDSDSKVDTQKKISHTIISNTAYMILFIIIASIFATSMLVLNGSIATAANIEVSKEKYLTNSSVYDKSSSLVMINGQYYLFYTRTVDDAQTVSTPGYNPDTSEYTINYKTASSLDGLLSAQDVQAEISSTNRPIGFSQGTISAVEFNNKIYVFTSSENNGTDQSIYYYTYDTSISDEQSRWSGPNKLVEDSNTPLEQQNSSLPHYSAYDVNVQSDDDTIYVAWSTSEGSFVGFFDGEGILTNINSVSLGDNGILYNARIYVDNKKMYVAGLIDTFDAIVLYTASVSSESNLTFNMVSYIVNDPAYTQYSLIKYNSILYFLSSYSDSTTTYLQYAYSDDDGESWYSQKDLTTAKLDADLDRAYTASGESWRDLSSRAYLIDNKINIIYTTESYDNSKSNGRITYFSADITKDLVTGGIAHYTSIQNAVDYASENDNISVSPGTYHEKMYINRAMELHGNNSIILGYDDTAVIGINSGNVIIEGFTIKGGVYGILVEYGIDSTGIVLNNNIIIENTDAGIISYGNGLVDARYNYWGDLTGPSGRGSGYGQAVIGEVRYSPWYYNEEFIDVIYDEVMSTIDYLEFVEIAGPNIDQEHIIYNLQLLKVSQYGAYIDWVSNDSGTINSKGVINKSSSDKAVTLTAKVYVPGSHIIERAFEDLIVKAKYDDTTSVDEEYDALTFNTIKETNTLESDIQYYIYLPTTGVKDTTIAWSTNNSDSIETDGNVMRSATDVQVTLTANISKNGISRIKTIELIVKGTTDADYLKIARVKKALSATMILNSNPSLNNIYAGLYLPTTMPGFNGVTITYLPSDSNAVSITSRALTNIVFNQASTFGDTISAESIISQEHYVDSEYGPIYGTNVIFSCGGCGDATFNDAINILDDSTLFCGYERNTIQNIILDKRKICVYDVNMDTSFEILLKSYKDVTCFDNGDRSCTNSGGHTSYIRASYLGEGQVDRGNAENFFDLTATIYSGDKSDVKQFKMRSEVREHAISYDSYGTAVIYDNMPEIMLTSDNWMHVKKISVPTNYDSNTQIFMNMEKIGDYYSKSVTIPSRGLEVVRQYTQIVDNTTFTRNVTLEFDGNSVINGGNKWNGLFIIPTIRNNDRYVVPQGDVYLALEVGESSVASNLSSTHMSLSSPLKLTFEGITGKNVAYTSSSYSQGNSTYDLTSITAVCDNANWPTNIVSPGECYIDTGQKIIVWTYHLSSYALYISNVTNTVTSSPDTSGESGAGGGGGGGPPVEVKNVTKICVEDWSCAKWSTCSALGASIRYCTDSNSCGTVNNKPATIQFCGKTVRVNNVTGAKALFDIIVETISEPSKDKSELVLDVGLINFGSPDTIDANLEFTIRDSRGSVVVQYTKIVEVKTQTEFIENIDMSGLSDGKYYLTVDLKYAGQEDPARAEMSFAMGDNSFIRTLIRIGGWNIVVGLGVVAILIIGSVWYFRRKKNHESSQNDTDTKKEVSNDNSNDSEGSESTTENSEAYRINKAIEEKYSPDKKDVKMHVEKVVERDAAKISTENKNSEKTNRVARKVLGKSAHHKDKGSKK